MIYLDTSVVLLILLKQEGASSNWKKDKMSDVNLRRAFETLFDREALTLRLMVAL